MAERLLENQVALVTGGSKGIGRAISLGYADHGARHLIIVSRGETAKSEAEALQTVADIQARGAKATWIKADLSLEDGVGQVITRLAEDSIGVDTLVNNAGATFTRLAEKNELGLLDASYRLNLRSPVDLACQLKASGLYGPDANVIGIASVIGQYGNIGALNYAAMKAAVLGVTKTLAEEWGPEGIRVNTIYPGYIVTDLTANVPEGPLQALEDMTPLNRLGTPEDVAGPAIFLASRLAFFVTGAGLNVDGGLDGKTPAAFTLYDAGYRRLTYAQRQQLQID